MIIVDQPYLYPGVCILSGQGGPDAGPYVDLMTEDAAGCRRYIAVSHVVELARVIGGGGPHEMEAARETTEAYEALQAKHEELERKFEALEAAVANTLAVGAVFDRKTTRPKLRRLPAGYALAKVGADA